MSNKTLLDTDVLSAIMRRELNAWSRVQQYLSEFPQLSFSLITRFEILRGLKAKRASTQIQKFDQLCTSCEILLVTPDIVDLASDLYADLYQRGELIGDADLLIPASALTHGLILATNNSAHFARITKLQIDNWLQ